MGTDDGNSDEGDRVERRVAEYLSRRLDPQTGRALAAFRNAASREPKSSRGRRWFAAAVTLAAAATVLAVVWGGHRPAERPRPMVEPSTEVVHLPPAPLDEEPSLLPGQVHVAQVAVTAQAEPRVVEELVRYRTLDEGVVVIDGRRPVRKLRRQWLERIAWFDAASGARVERIVPREELVYVGIPVN